MEKVFWLFAAAGILLPLRADVALKADFERNSGYLYCKGGTTSIAAAKDAHGGRNVLVFNAGDKVTTLTSGTMMSSQYASPRVKLSFFARGKGKINAGLSDGIYLGKGKYKYTPYGAKEDVVLTDQWQKIEFTRDFSGTAPVGVYVRIRLSPGGEAQIDDLLMETVAEAGVKVSAKTPDAILRLGEPLPECRFDVTPQGTALTGLVILPDRSFTAAPPGKTVLPGLYRVTATAAGATAETRFSVLPQEQYDAVAKAAAKIKFGKPVRILFLGDSIYDFNRGRNAADKVIYFLERNNPGKISFRNAAVAGDYITRVEDRLNGKGRDVKKYAGLFDKPCDLIFIALGSNDNRTLRSDGYGKPLVPFAEQTAAMIRVIRFLKAKNPGARIVLISPSCAHEAFLEKRAAAAEKRNQDFVKFGVPELTLQGIAAQKKAAAAEKAEYLDLYQEMRQAARPEFFARNDVIHLDEPGFSFLAQKILEYLADNPKEK